MAETNPLESSPVVRVKKGFPRSFGRYVLEKSLSRGGMGEVFLTVAKTVNKRCVIKTIRGDLTGDAEFIGRFADEAKIMMRISHNNIIRVFDAGKVGTDYYIAMEYVHGRDLGDVLDRAYERGEPLPTQLGLYAASKLLDGLDYAHKLCDEHGRHMGLVHRDVSPQNVLIGFDGSVKLIDFGLARTELLPGRTQGALAVGKYGYMPPEQARHEKIDGRADVYSTGVMLFEVFTGDRLVDEQDQATLWSRVLNPKHRRPTSVVPDLPKEIDDLIMTAVAIETEARFAGADEMLRFVSKLRGEKSSREELVRYLRQLYPKVDFNPPPIPEFGDAIEEGEHSMIIATSAEGAKSVFGRGELPIEWTAQINVADIQLEFERRKRREEKPRPAAVDAAVTEAAAPVVARETDELEPTRIRARDEVPLSPSARAYDHRDVRVSEVMTSGDALTQINEIPIDSVAPVSADTRYVRTPLPGYPAATPVEENTDTHHAAGVLGITPMLSGFRDDERTVMMDSPPRALVDAPPPAPATRPAVRPSREIMDERTLSPTRLNNNPMTLDASETAATLPPIALSPPSATSRGRAIEERYAGRSGGPAMRGGAQRANPNRAVALRSTVPSEANTPPPARRPGREEKRPDSLRAILLRILPEKVRGNTLYVGGGIFLVLALVIVWLVMSWLGLSDGT